MKIEQKTAIAIAKFSVVLGIFCLAAALYFIFATMPVHAGEALKEKICKDDPFSVAQQLVSRDFPEKVLKVRKVVKNDLRCEAVEHMANFGIMVKFTDESKKFGIFHLHWVHVVKYNVDGVDEKTKIVPRLVTPSKRTKREWKRAEDMNAVYAPWCKMMKSVAKDDSLEQARCGDFWNK